jgi:hypothetical protein
MVSARQDASHLRYHVPRWIAKLTLATSIVFHFQCVSRSHSVRERNARDFASLQDAIDAACDGVHAGRVILPPGVITESVRVPSACTIIGQGGSSSVLRAPPSATGPVVEVSAATHVRLINFGCDGGAVTAAPACVRITGARDVLLSGIEVRHANTNGIVLIGSNTNVLIDACRVWGNGPRLPSSAGSGVGVVPGNGRVEHLRIRRCEIYGNNLGIVVFNSASPEAPLSGLVIENNTVFGNANDGIGINAANRDGGLIISPQIFGNKSFCNGWHGAPMTGCTPQALQSGVHHSSSGVGIDLIGALIREPQVRQNVTYMNVFDGISADGRTFTRARVLGSRFERIDGDAFGSHWFSQNVRINDQTYTVHFVNDDVMSVVEPVAIASPVLIVGSSLMKGSFAANIARDNGAGAVGAGIWNDGADGNRYEENVATNNNFEGFGCNHSSLVRYAGGKAYGNQRARVRRGDYVSQGCTSVSYEDIDALSNETPNPGVGIYIDEHSRHLRIVRSKRRAVVVDDRGLDTTLE